MNLASLRNSVLSSAFVVLSSALLSSCGGGGAASPGPVGGPPQILPESGTLYAGVEYTFTISGGRPPYFLSSSEPALLAVPAQTSANFINVIPANPGVIDSGLAPEDLPVRTVTLTMRDSVGSTMNTQQGLKVGINFMTGYGISFNSNCPTTGTRTSAVAPAACAGGETAVTLRSVIAGNRYGNRQYRFEIVRGPLTWTFPNGQLQGGTISGNTVTTSTDHVGDAHVFFRVNAGVATQLAVIRAIDVATGASQTYVFTINGTSSLGGTLTAIPNTLTFTGATTASCGTGASDVLVFDGLPPYRATSTDPGILVTPDRSDENPGRFRIAATNPNVCLSNGTVVITDANNARTTVTVTTEAGSAAPPPTPISVTPGQVTLGCGTSSSVSILGGASSGGTFSPSSSDARITATVATRTLTVARLNTDPVGTPASPSPGVPNLINYTVTVTDGASSANVGVTAPSNCPP